MQDTDELYKLFENAIDRKTFDRVLEYFKADKRRVKGAIVDLMVLYFIKKGLRKKHLLYLSRRLGGGKQFRTNHLAARFDYMNEYINDIN